jgi:Glycerophosphoryl diester phosphodiesterase
MPPAATERSETVSAPQSTRAPMPEFFDCLRENGGVVIAAHRGGPYPGLPENSLEAMQANYDQGIRLFEIDVAESQDGQLFLLHDRTLQRTTTIEGFVAETNWRDIRDARLKDRDGTVTRFSPPTLQDTLEWAVTNNAIVELDKKDTAGWRGIVEAVRETNAEQNVILISYSDDQAAKIADLAPDLMLTASARGARDIQALVDRGVRKDRLIAWTGTREPDAAAWTRVSREGVEAAFGTLGRPGQRLDDTYLADGDGSEFAALEADGLVLLATDAPLEAARAMSGDERAKEACEL